MTASTSQQVHSALDETLLWLCAIESPIGEERALSEAIERRLHAGRECQIQRYGDSIVARLGPQRKALPHIVLAGHTDTVRTENGPARIEAGRCFGSGASDMKSGLAIMLVLSEMSRRDLWGANVTLVFYAREEGPFAENELGPVLDRDPHVKTADLAVCLEPSDNRLHLGCVGSIHATVTFEGQTSHSARPWEGVSAVSLAAPLLAELAQRTARVSVIDGLTYRTVTTVTAARDGGRGRNVVPDRFVLNLNHRFAPDTSLEEAKREVMSLVGDRATIEFSDLSPAALPSANHPLVQKLIAGGVRGIEPKQAWTDVARFAAMGIPAINFGPGENKQAHQKNESTALDLVHEGYGMFERWLQAIADRTP